ncbi:uncharacterized protein LOC144643510 isoform X2 [Oculina patagonica]
MAEAKRMVILAVVSLILYAGSVASSSDLHAVFSMGGIKGDVIFSQPQENGPTNIMVKLTGINETLTWSIQQLPMIYDGNAAMSCSVGAVFDPKMAKKSADYNTKCLLANDTRFESCAVGDLSKMLGDLDDGNSQQNFTNQNLMIPIRGPYSIMGRTLVLYSGDTAKACALITPAQTMKTAVAVFKFPVAGSVYLRQVDENSDTSVFVDLFFVNDAQSGSQLKWQINQRVISDDASDPSSYCKQVGEMFNPKNVKNGNCNETMHGNCAIGDLTSKHGNIEVSVATEMKSSTKAAFTDTNLPLDGANMVISESMVLFSASDPPKPVACAKIVHLEPKTLKVSFNADVHQGVSGYFKFTQSSPFDPATTEIKLSGLQKKAQGYHVHAYPSPSYMHLTPSQSCQGLIAGDHWNPFNIDLNKSPPAGTGTDDEYEIGDLSGKYGSFLNLTTYEKTHTDYNLPLFGRNSIQGRSVVIHKLKIQDNNARWVCDNLVLVVDPATSYVMKATANFTGPKLTGVILMDQYFSSKPDTAGQESTIFIDIKYTEDRSTETSGHKWDVHDNPVGGDARDSDVNKRCMSLEGKFNPYGVYTQGSYSSACKPTNMLRCQSGDLAGKHTPFKVGGGRQLYNDVNLPLFGRNSAVGHGIAMNDKDGGNDRLGCANIVADSSLFAEDSLEYKKEAEFSSAQFVDTISKALEIPKWRLFNIRTEKGNADDCLIVKFGIIGEGGQVSLPVKKFNDIRSNDPGALKQYQPSKDCDPKKDPSGTRGHHANFFLMVTVVMATIVMGGLQLI